MGLAEESSKVAAGAIDALKSHPACLAAILLAAIFAALTFFAMQNSEARNQDARLALIERCFPGFEKE